MTKIKKGGSKSSGRRKNPGPAERVKGGAKGVAKSKPSFKQQNRRQYGGWRGSNNQDRSWGLSYENSQQKNRSSLSTDFSSIFAPSKSGSEQQSNIVELGLLIRKHLVGPLIGKKGKTIWMIRDRSNGANIDFGNDDIVVDRSKDKKWQQSPWPDVEPEKFNVCAISGSKAQAVVAAKVIAELLAKRAQSPQCRLEFLIPEEYVGVFIGKKGANIKQIKEQVDVTVDIRDDPILLGNNRVTLCTLFGPAEGMMTAIERTAKWLGDISVRARQDKEN